MVHPILSPMTIAGTLDVNLNLLQLWDFFTSVVYHDSVTLRVSHKTYDIRVRVPTSFAICRVLSDRRPSTISPKTQRTAQYSSYVVHIHIPIVQCIPNLHSIQPNLSSFLNIQSSIGLLTISSSQTKPTPSPSRSHSQPIKRLTPPPLSPPLLLRFRLHRLLQGPRLPQQCPLPTL